MSSDDWKFSFPIDYYKELAKKFDNPENMNSTYSTASGQTSSISIDDVLESMKKLNKHLRERDWFTKLAKESGIDNPDQYVVLMPLSEVHLYNLENDERVIPSEYINDLYFVRKDLMKYHTSMVFNITTS